MSRGTYGNKRPRVGASNAQTRPPAPQASAPQAPPPSPTKPNNGLWWKMALAIGAGVASYTLVWPAIRRRIWPSEHAPVVVTKKTDALPAATVTTATATSSAPSGISAIEQFARDRGFSSLADYENSVILNARQAYDAGADVSLPPHLAHLAQRLTRR